MPYSPKPPRRSSQPTGSRATRSPKRSLPDRRELSNALRSWSSVGSNSSAKPPIRPPERSWNGAGGGYEIRWLGCPSTGSADSSAVCAVRAMQAVVLAGRRCAAWSGFTEMLRILAACSSRLVGSTHARKRPRADEPLRRRQAGGRVGDSQVEALEPGAEFFLGGPCEAETEEPRILVEPPAGPDVGSVVLVERSIE